MTRQLDAVVFDLDGVLIDSEGAWDDARRRVVAALGGRWRDDATRAMMGMSSAEWSRYMRDTLEVPRTVADINGAVVSQLLEGYALKLPLVPGAVEAVTRLAGAWPLGLASSSNRRVIEYVLATSGLEECFTATVSSEEVAHGKPAPDVYLAATLRLDVAPESAAAVEDSSNGLRAAAAARLLVIAIPNREFPPSDDSLALAAAVLGSLGELTPGLLRSLIS